MLEPLAGGAEGIDLIPRTRPHRLRQRVALGRIHHGFRSHDETGMSRGNVEMMDGIAVVIWIGHHA